MVQVTQAVETRVEMAFDHLSEIESLFRDGLREADRRELYLASGPWWRENLWRGLVTSDRDLTWVVRYQGQIAIVAGVAADDYVRDHPVENRAFPWMVASPALDEEWGLKLFLARRSLGFLALIMRKYNYLENWVYSKNEVSLSWLSALGFVILPAQPWGYAGADFCHAYFGPEQAQVTFGCPLKRLREETRGVLR